MLQKPTFHFMPAKLLSMHLLSFKEHRRTWHLIGFRSSFLWYGHYHWKRDKLTFTVSAKEVHTLNHQTISPDFIICFYVLIILGKFCSRNFLCQLGAQETQIPMNIELALLPLWWTLGHGSPTCPTGLHFHLLWIETLKMRLRLFLLLVYYISKLPWIAWALSVYQAQG